MSTSLKHEENDALRPRLCHLRKWSFFQGYGFNLHAEKTRNGQFIGKVDANSPAESAGLKEKDRIIEVNYVNISNENHQQVVKRIRNGLEIDGKQVDNEVVLLVVDAETDEYYKKLNLIVKNDFENVLKMVTPTEEEYNRKVISKSPVTTPTVSDKISQHSRNSADNHSTYENEDNNDTSNTHVIDSNNNKNETVENKQLEIYENSDKLSVNSASNHNDTTSHNSHTSNNETSQSNKKIATPNLSERSTNLNKPTPPHTPKSQNSNESTSRLNVSASATNNSTNGVDPFKMSAAEFKDYLKNKQRVDPRIAPQDMKQKFQIFQNM